MGKNIKFIKLRKGVGLTQRALADRSGVNIRQVQKIEGGESCIGNIALSTAIKLADALNVDVKTLI